MKQGMCWCIVDERNIVVTWTDCWTWKNFLVRYISENSVGTGSGANNNPRQGFVLVASGCNEKMWDGRVANEDNETDLFGLGLMTWVAGVAEEYKTRLEWWPWKCCCGWRDEVGGSGDGYEDVDDYFWWRAICSSGR